MFSLVCLSILICVLCIYLYALSPFIGKSTPSAVDETLYSELKPGTTLGNDAALCCYDVL